MPAGEPWGHSNSCSVELALVSMARQRVGFLKESSSARVSVSPVQAWPETEREKGSVLFEVRRDSE